jgi:hypothetical protein
MSYIFNMLIYVGMILLDNMLSCLLFIAMIDISRTWDTVISLIYYALVIFMIYFWIKIKLKMLIYLFKNVTDNVFAFASLLIDSLLTTTGWRNAQQQ